MDESRNCHQHTCGGEEQLLHIDNWIDIKTLAANGWAIRKISRELGIDRNTVRKVLRQKEFQGYAPRPEMPGILDTWSSFIAERAPQVDFNATKLYQELSSKGYQGSYSSVKLAVRPIREKYVSAEKAFIRFETPPGRQSQVDWGSTWIDLAGERQRIHIFVMVLGYSRAIYVEFTFDEKLDTLIACHENAFEWFNGRTEEILYDNMKTVVLSREGGKIHFHPRFEDFAAVHGFVPRACQPARPQTKGKVESGVRYIKKSFLPGMAFSSLEQLNSEVQLWIRQIADQRIHGTTHRQPAEMFKEERLFPFNRSVFNERSTSRSVAKDCLISYRCNKYSVPWQYVGKEVDVQVLETGILQVSYAGKVIAMHELLSGRYCVGIQKEHFNGIYRQRSRLSPPLDVEVRSLSVYEQIASGGER